MALIQEVQHDRISKPKATATSLLVSVASGEKSTSRLRCFHHDPRRSEGQRHSVSCHTSLEPNMPHALSPVDAQVLHKDWTDPVQRCYVCCTLARKPCQYWPRATCNAALPFKLWMTCSSISCVETCLYRQKLSEHFQSLSSLDHIVV